MTLRILCLLVWMIGTNSHGGQVAFIGDSLSTGGAAHPYLAVKLSSFRDILEGRKTLAPDEDYFKQTESLGYQFKDAPPPMRLHRSTREFQHPVFWFLDNLWTKFGSQFLDAEEYAWPYLMGRALGYQPKDILIAARDGERISHGIRQVDRLLDYTKGKLPEKIFIFFTGNDLCGPTIDYVTDSDDYKSSLKKILKYIRINGTPSVNGTSVYVMNPMGIIQIVTSSEILSHKVPFHDNEISCKELHVLKPGSPTNSQGIENPQGDIVEAVFNMVAGSPSGYCGTLFSIHDGNTQAQITLSNRINQYREGIEAVVKEFNEFAGTEVMASQITGTADILFDGPDMANDCFHLGLGGHDKIAKAVLKELK